MSKPTYILYNGRYYETGEAVFTTANRSFRYGDGIFETIRVVKGKIHLFDDHYQRMSDSANFLKIETGTKQNKAFFREKILDVCKKNGVEDSARVRLSLFRADGGLYEPESNKASYSVEAEPSPKKGYPLNKKGLKIDLYSGIEKPLGLYSNIKSCNAHPYVLASIFRKERKIDNCLITNTKNRVAEAISSNVFVVKDEKVYTPPLTEGCVAGVMRSYILDILADNQIPFLENPVTLEELFVADEVFLTDAIHGIRWIGNYKIKEYGVNLTKEISGILEKKLKTR